MSRASRARAFVLWRATGLPDEDRAEFASFVLRRDVSSWSEFNASDWRAIIAALSGWFAVRELRRQRGKKPDC